ncbi:MAG: winged helix-turn-helix transcriptional regulator [Planctomycetota bacterium]
MSTISDPEPKTSESPSRCGGGMAGGSSVRHIDRELLMCLRSGESQSIGELMSSLGVTATAVRQRVDRLLELGLIDREKIVAGRGRPSFRYLLTVDGFRAAGANTSDLAEAMWREILSFDDSEARSRLISGIARRMGGQIGHSIAPPASLDEDVARFDSETPRFSERMRSVAQVLRDREVSVEFAEVGDLPVLDIAACPYPSLTDASDDRSMCRLEEEMLSEALGETVRLSQCRLDGDSCCQFSTEKANHSDQALSSSETLKSDVG